jgi:hypothetical protein
MRASIWCRTIASSVLVLALGAGFSAQATTSAAPAAATVTCKDGSTSKAGKGACSHHGGIQKGGTAAPAAAAAAPAAPAPAPAAAPVEKKPTAAAKDDSNATAAGAIAKCKDGTFSHAKQHKGACSRHGGVGQWLDKN